MLAPVAVLVAVALGPPCAAGGKTRELLPKPLPEPETRTTDDFELFLEGILEAPRGPGAVISSGRYAPASRTGPTGCANGTCDQGQRIPYAPVFVRPTLQWAVPNTPPSGPPAAPQSGPRQPPR
jgi:pilus assembly protein CpaC